MIPHICLGCDKSYYDTADCLSIVMDGLCISCVEDTRRWEDEGGPYIPIV